VRRARGRRPRAGRVGQFVDARRLRPCLPVLSMSGAVTQRVTRDAVARRCSMHSTHMQEAMAPQAMWDFSDLRALFINCTLKRSPETSNTQGLADISIEIMRRQGVTVDVVRAIDRDIATGVWPDMTEHGWGRDEWPAIYEQVQAAHILVLCTPIWLGEKSSV